MGDDAALLGPEGEARAHELDAEDDAASQRHLFAVPDGEAYLAGNSLGLQPLAVRAAVDEVLDSWATRGVGGHLEGEHPWVTYHETMLDTAARLVGALPGEAVAMNSLTVNLHLLLGSFFRPTPTRHRIIIEADAFPSDRYAVTNVARAHGYDPTEAVAFVTPRDGECDLRTEDVTAYLDHEGGSVAVVLLGAVNYLTGGLLDIAAITEAAHRAGAVAAWDLAHAVGNVPLAIHDADVDFAVWCHYKYVNAGPGAIGGCFVHERHGADRALVRPGGWWGHDPRTRFGMAPVRVALDIFDRVGLERLRARSIRLTGFLEQLVDLVASRHPLRLVTTRDPARRGAQLTVEVSDAAWITRVLFARHRVRCDDRPPNLIRLAPAPLYNTFHDCWRAAAALDAELAAR
jgi:kynureninase